MKRTATGLCVAAAMAFAVTLAAQTSTTTTPRSSTTTDKMHDVTVTGCLARDASGGYILNNARMENGTSSTTAGTTGGSTTTTSGTTTTSSRASGRTEMSNSAAMTLLDILI